MKTDPFHLIRISQQLSAEKIQNNQLIVELILVQSSISRILIWL